MKSIASLHRHFTILEITVSFRSFRDCDWAAGAAAVLGADAGAVTVVAVAAMAAGAGIKTGPGTGGTEPGATDALLRFAMMRCLRETFLVILMLPVTLIVTTSLFNVNILLCSGAASVVGLVVVVGMTTGVYATLPSHLG